MRQCFFSLISSSAACVYFLRFAECRILHRNDYPILIHDPCNNQMLKWNRLHALFSLSISFLINQLALAFSVWYIISFLIVIIFIIFLFICVFSSLFFHRFSFRINNFCIHFSSLFAIAINCSKSLCFLRRTHTHHWLIISLSRCNFFFLFFFFLRLYNNALPAVLLKRTVEERKKKRTRFLL